jgi:hypothetical protein
MRSQTRGAIRRNQPIPADMSPLQEDGKEVQRFAAAAAAAAATSTFTSRKKAASTTQQILAHAKVGASLVVNASRKDRTSGLWQEAADYDATLQSRRVGSDGQNLFSFDDENQDLLAGTYSLDNEHTTEVRVVKFYIKLNGVHGLPPRGADAFGRPISSPPTFAIYAGMDHRCGGTESAVGLVLRAPEQFQGTAHVWTSERDLPVPPQQWATDEEAGRVYISGMPQALGVLCLTAACRWAKIVADEHYNNAQPHIVIIVEKELIESYKSWRNYSARRATAALNQRQQQPDAATQLMINLSSAFAALQPNVTMLPTNFSSAAHHAAIRKRASQPSSGDNLSKLEASLFDPYVGSMRDNLQLRKQKTSAAAAAATPLQPTRSLEIAQQIREPEHFASLQRGNHARSYVPREAKEVWAATLNSHLLAVKETEPRSERRTDALIAVLILPSLALPVKGRAINIAERLGNGGVFNVRFEGATNPKQQPRPKQQRRWAQPPTAAVAANQLEADRIKKNSNNDDDPFDVREDATAEALQHASPKLVQQASLSGGKLSRSEMQQRDQAVTKLTEEVDAAVVESEKQRAGVVDETEQQQTKKKLERLALRVEMLANDFKMRSARKLIFTVVENDGKPDMDFDEKIAALRKKLPAAEQDTPGLNLENCRVVPVFDRDTVINTLKKMPRQAASCVESWCPAHVLQAADVIPDILDHVAWLCAEICNDQFDERGYNMLRCGRCVPIPKPDGGIRPITLSCFFVKLAGSLVWSDFGYRDFENQFAIACPDGATRVVHQVRQERKNGMAIIKIDVSNAFNSARRSEMIKELNDRNVRMDGSYDYVMRYFSVIYGRTTPAKLVSYGPDGRIELLDEYTGVRQGDSFSVWFFCLIMDVVRRRIIEQCPALKDLIRIYVDDFTVTAPPEHALWVMNLVMQEMEALGFKTNPDKSSILANDKSEIGAYPIVATELGACAERESMRKPICEAARSRPDMCLHPFKNGEKFDPYQNWSDEDFEKQRAAESEECKTRIETNKTIYASFFEKVGLDGAEDKTVLDKMVNVKKYSKDNSFIVLGAEMSDNYTELIDKQTKKLCGFFDVIEAVPLHPQLAFTLARICGFSKARYIGNVTPPEHSSTILKAFTERTIEFLEKLLGFDITDQVFCHNGYGLGIPNYYDKRVALYENSRNAGIMSISALPTQLVNNIIPKDERTAAHCLAQQHAPWMLYQPRGRDTRLDADTFRTAMAVRCCKLPRSFNFTAVSSCRCEHTFKDEQDLIVHAMNCNHTGFSTAMRHTMVKRCLARVLNRYNFATTVEPTFYESSYHDGIKHRPDLVVWTPRPIAIDVTIVQQHANAPGREACTAAAKKDKLHGQIVANCGHVFSSFVLETHGFEHTSVKNFVQKVSQNRPPYEAKELEKEVCLCVSVELARARAHALDVMLQRFRFEAGDEQGDIDLGEGLKALS